MTPRQVRLELQKIETWMTQNHGSFDNEDKFVIKIALTHAYTEDHLNFLREFIKTKKGS